MMLHLSIFRTLVRKERQRYTSNRGAMVLAVLLVVMSFVLSVFGEKGQGSGNAVVTGMHHCIIDCDLEEYDQDWMLHLERSRPPQLAAKIYVRPMSRAFVQDGVIVYPTGNGALQIRRNGIDEAGRAQYRISRWLPPGVSDSEMMPYTSWLLRESRRFFLDRFQKELQRTGQLAQVRSLPSREVGADESELLLDTHRQLRSQLASLADTLQWPSSDIVRVPELQLEPSTPLTGAELDTRSTLAMALVLFGLFFSCIYLMPSLTCEERERGILLAQMLSPASALDILAAKYVFYPTLGLILCAVIAGVYYPAVLASRFFWLAIVVLAIGSMGIGLTIASLARTQREASMGALCYMLVVTSFLMICQTANIQLVPWIFLEFHGPRMIHAAISDRVTKEHWIHLSVATIVSVVWTVFAVRVFRKKGWQ